MFKKISVMLLAAISLQAGIYEYDIRPSSLNSPVFMGIEILDSKDLEFDKVDGIKVSELSALAYDGTTLYALSDRGYLYHFKISLKDEKIKKLKLKKAYELKDKKGRELKKAERDSEGLSLVDDKLLISFEQEPRVELYSKKGKKLKNKKIHHDLKDVKDYISKNKALEGVAYNEKQGVVTAPELPFDDGELHTLFAKEKIWKFKRSGSITALEFIGSDDILVLERDHNMFNFQTVITISRVYLGRCKNDICQSDTLAVMDSKKGWKIDNFEGLTKVDNKRFLMISDDNDSFLQKTLLVLFEIR